MHGHEREHEVESPDEADDGSIREAQEGTGYGEDEGERDAGLERETDRVGGADAADDEH